MKFDIITPETVALNAVRQAPEGLRRAFFDKIRLKMKALTKLEIDERTPSSINAIMGKNYCQKQCLCTHCGQSGNLVRLRAVNGSAKICGKCLLQALIAVDT